MLFFGKENNETTDCDDCNYNKNDNYEYVSHHHNCDKDCKCDSCKNECKPKSCCVTGPTGPTRPCG